MGLMSPLNGPLVSLRRVTGREVSNSSLQSEETHIHVLEGPDNLANLKEMGLILSDTSFRNQGVLCLLLPSIL